MLGPDLNDGMHEENVAAAVNAAKSATDTAVTEMQIALARALVLPDASEGGDRDLLNKAFADAMAKVATRFPDDPNSHFIHADALMNMQP